MCNRLSTCLILAYVSLPEFWFVLIWGYVNLHEMGDI